MQDNQNDQDKEQGDLQAWIVAVLEAQERRRRLKARAEALAEIEAENG